ncbi:MAG: DUF4407 domain-containing protein [Crocinitomix sp.]|nr:DUF4407 domain-containing protein [Crocinitomix sp.]
MDTTKADLKEESSLTLFFWWCAGADADLLRQLDSDKQRYFLIGTTVLITALFAAISGIYVFSSVFQNIPLAVIFGIMWGMLIFTLDRYVVATVSRGSNFTRTLLQLLPRFLISILISIVIATPLSLRLFEDEIQKEHSKQFYEEMLSIDMIFEKQKANIEEQISALQEKIDLKLYELNKREKEYEDEIMGVNGSGLSGSGPIAVFKRQQYEYARHDYNDARTTTDSLITSLNKQLLTFHAELNSSRSYVIPPMTFVAMSQAFAELKTKDSTINLISLMLTLFIMLISTAPIVVQISSRKSLYEEYLSIKNKILINKFVVSQEGQNNMHEELKSEVEELKKKLDDLSKDKINKMIDELEGQKKETHQNINFQIYFNQMLDGLSQESDKIEQKAKEFYWQGMVFSIMGILTAFGFFVFWINYFSIKKFEPYNIIELISGTIIIIIIEFLGAWFLKQNKELSKKSLHILKIKSTLDRYLLIYLSIDEFASSDTRENYLKQLLSTLDKDIRFPTESSTINDTSFNQEAFSTIRNLTDSIKNLTNVT